MKKNTRLLASWLCTLLIIPSFASCVDQTGTITETHATDTSTQTVTVEESIDPTQAALNNALTKLSDQDFGGYDFRIMDRNTTFAVFETIDVWSAAESGDTINDAVYRRNGLLEEKLNISLSEHKVDAPAENAKTAVMAGSDDFDILTDGLSRLSKIIADNTLADLTQIDSLKLSESWWDQDMTQNLTIANKLFFCTGDISIMDNYGTWCIMFNKDMVETYDLDNLYEHVRNGTWTIQLMYDMSKEVAKDLDGNGKLNDTDQWGFLTEVYNQYGLWASGGERIISKDENDLPVLSALSDRAVDVMRLVTEFTQDKSCTLIAENATTRSSNGPFHAEHFGAGNALFIYGGMWLITKFRAYDVNFGVVPSPKYDEHQERYCNTYSYGHCTAYAIPTTAPDIERTGLIMEAMAEISKYTLTPAYYDIALKGKYIRDEESAEMLDIILAQRAYDLGMIFDWGSMFSTITSMATRRNPDFASLYEKREKPTLKAIEKFVDALDTLE